MDILSAGAGAYKMLAPCFTAEMLLDAEGGKKRADSIQKGDRLWSRSEFDPNGPIELKEVEEVFVRVSPVINLHVGGQIIRTTREHPFYVEGRGWIPAGMLDIGDLLSTRDGQMIPVQGVADTGEVTTVYNWRVAEWHTYFVASAEYGFSLWAHNTYSPGRAGKQARLRELAGDDNVSSAHRGWIKQELNAIGRGNRTTVRVPPGTQLAHRRGFEAKNGFSYKYSDLQNTDLHRLQHKHEGY